MAVHGCHSFCMVTTTISTTLILLNPCPEDLLGADSWAWTRRGSARKIWVSSLIITVLCLANTRKSLADVCFTPEAKAVSARPGMCTVCCRRLLTEFPDRSQLTWPRRHVS